MAALKATFALVDDFTEKAILNVMNLPTNNKRQRLQIGQRREANQSATFSTKFLGTFQTKDHDLIITNIDNVIMTLMKICS